MTVVRGDDSPSRAGQYLEPGSKKRLPARDRVGIVVRWRMQC